MANLSQGGVFGSLMGTPIINVPQTGQFSCTIFRVLI